MLITATVKPGDKKLKNIDAIRLNGAFLDFEKSKEVLEQYKHKLSIVDVPNGRKKKRTNDYTDEEIVEWSKENGVDYLAISYVKSKRDLKYDYPMMAKIETRASLRNIENILDNVEVIMIDRFDLAEAIGWHRLPKAIRMVTKKAKMRGVIVLVASQVLPTMAKTGTPAVTEVTAINDMKWWADGVVLEETAYADDPQNIVNFVNKLV